jgi:16S rRNA (uracil1498-N3)-methyltransferase
MHTLRRFYAGPGQVQGEVIRLDREETHHLVRVLRLGVGARVAVFDGRGLDLEAEVKGLDPEGAQLRVVRRLAPWGESPLDCSLGIGLAKGDVLEAVIGQATEMGVRRILPFISARSEGLTPERAARRLSRWQKLARESLKSCRRSHLPQLDPPQDFAGVLAGPEEVKLLCWEEERGGGLKTLLKGPRPGAVRLLIGPEGGFSPEEAARAREAGYRSVSLGPRRLKVATAALTALALLQFAWGDLA